MEINTEMKSLDELPYDILLTILQELDFKDLINISQVNKKLNLSSNDNILWKAKLLKDSHRWKRINSRTWPKQLEFKSYPVNKIIINKNKDGEKEEEDVTYKKIYLDICPEITTNKEILQKIKSFQHIQNTLNATSTSESFNSFSNNLTLSSLSSFAMPMMVFGQLKDFVYRNVFQNEQFFNNSSFNDNENIPKIVLFGPGLETSTSCLVTNILWKSEFKTVGMIPGKDGYGAGIKLKLFNHKPFNLTILYTNNKKARTGNNERYLDENRLLFEKKDGISDGERSYELNPRVREACSNAHGFIYVIDNDNLSLNKNFGEIESKIENNRNELSILMKAVDNSLPLLVLSLKVNDLSDVSDKELCEINKKSLSCVDIINLLDLNKLKQDWQIRNCQIFQPKMKEIIFGFEWILNELDQKFLSQQDKDMNEDSVEE